MAPGAPAQNFSVFDSLKQKDNGRAGLTVRTLPSPQTEGEQPGDVRQIPLRKKLIINKRKKEMIHTQRGKIVKLAAGDQIHFNSVWGDRDSGIQAGQ